MGGGSAMKKDSYYVVCSFWLVAERIISNLFSKQYGQYPFVCVNVVAGSLLPLAVLNY